MKKVLVLVASSLVGFSAVSAENNLSFNVGADAQWRFMPLNKNFGGNMVKQNYPQGAVYGGVRLDDSYGIEFGYQSNISTKRKGKPSTGTSYFGSVLPAPIVDSYFKSYSKISVQGFYAGVLGLLPISEEYRLKLIGSVGLVRMRMKIIAGVDQVEPAATVRFTQDRFIQTKWIPKLTVGLQHMFNNNVGMRATAAWEQTSKFKRIVGVDTTTGIPGSIINASLKSSVNLGLGMFYNF